MCFELHLDRRQDSLKWDAKTDGKRVNSRGGYHSFADYFNLSLRRISPLQG
jgi:hypothetical protein